MAAMDITRHLVYGRRLPSKKPVIQTHSQNKFNKDFVRGVALRIPYNSSIQNVAGQQALTA